MKIIYSGGGTLGPVTPLLAIHEMVQETYPDVEVLWIGTKRGPERELIEQKGIRFQTLSSGKFRRYISIWNFTDIFRIIIGFFQSVKLMWKESPDLCVSAGGFISVPLHWAAWLFGVPTWIHQQDVKVGLANRLMEPVARIVTTSLKDTTGHFSSKKSHWLGNPVRGDIAKGSLASAVKRFELESQMPVVFATGGGTGSMRVNQLVVEASSHLEHVAQVIHLSGKERPHELTQRAAAQFSWYHHYLFFKEEMADAYAAADIVIARGGFGTLSELASLGKCAIIIPKPGHQQENIQFLADAGAVILVSEQTADGNRLGMVLKDLLKDNKKREEMGEKLHHMLPRAEQEHIIQIVDHLVDKKR